MLVYGGCTLAVMAGCEVVHDFLATLQMLHVRLSEVRHGEVEQRPYFVFERMGLWIAML